MYRGTKGGSGGGSSRKPVRNHSDTCRYPNRVCNQPVYDQYAFCLKHILEDKNAPFKPCGFTYASTNKRCLQPAPRGDKRDIGYCSTHLWKTQMKKQRAQSKPTPPVTAETLLSGLTHYMKSSTSALKMDDASLPTTEKTVNPFVEEDVKKVSTNRTQVLEYASDSDSDIEPATLETAWKASNEDSSDAESIDSQMDDPLRHASVFTAEEVVLITRNKLLRLQKLYQRQFERLAHVLKERRRKYIHSMRKEKETLGPIHGQNRSSAKEVKLYEKLKALNRYQKRSNSENLAYIASLEKKSRELQGSNYKPPNSTKCSFTEGGVRCSRVNLPLTKFCLKHILEDQNQSIFRKCGCQKAGNVCSDPVTKLCYGGTCVLHVRLSTLPHKSLSEEEDEMPLKCESVGEESPMDISGMMDESNSEKLPAELLDTPDLLPTPADLLEDSEKTPELKVDKPLELPEELLMESPLPEVPAEPEAICEPGPVLEPVPEEVPTEPDQPKPPDVEDTTANETVDSDESLNLQLGSGDSTPEKKADQPSVQMTPPREEEEMKMNVDEDKPVVEAPEVTASVTSEAEKPLPEGGSV